MRPLRLLHTSDVHIGGGFHPPEHGDHHDHCLCPLVAIEHLVAANAVDVMLVAGDLFDHQRVSASLVAEVLGRLGSLGVPCVVINGNHDVHDDGTVYDPALVDRSGVVFLDDHGGSQIELFDGALHLWAKAMPVHDRQFRPLTDAPLRPDPAAWWVVLGHGHYEPVEQDQFGRSSPLSPAEIEATGADYLALGHWHVRTDVSTENVVAWYSGAPHGVVSSGQMNLVDLCPGHGVAVQSLPVVLPAMGCVSPGPTLGTDLNSGRIRTNLY